MPIQILAIGTGQAESADQVISASTPVTFCLKDAAGPDLGPNVQVDILLKDDVGQYFQVDSLGARKKAVMIVAAGTYLFRRTATSDSCGVFSA